uniref:Uncharacterized conserved protein, contains ParB-like and HNH nuclease domains n=1 Tax=Candidatus Kentrum sp. SD TaxID=2126332 RepID=A0A451BI56_9GAMM|nr:MAG: Uncharacterized conserved protein, contains ParB-like and HNH nuclease domains [Candidatus Kentron sp. SD]
MSEEKFEENGLEIEADGDEDEIVAVNYDIASYPSDFTLSGISEMWKEKVIVIPNYQREFVWTIKQASLLIDSFLMGLPVPPVFFYVDKDNKNLVIDGQQRILSIVFFLEGYFGKESTQGRRQVFRLSGLHSNHLYQGKKFDELDEKEQRKLKQAVLRAVNIRQLSPIGESTSAYHIFERLNTGGTPLKPQEIRNCVFRGGLNKRLKEANNDTNWRKLLGKDDPDKHQKDVELLLRIFSLVRTWSEYESPMKEYLNRAMKQHDSGRTKKATRFFNLFPIITKRVVEEIGEKPFHLRVRGPLNGSALDSVMAVLIENHSKLDTLDLQDNFKRLLADKEFDEYTRTKTTDTKTVRDRCRIVEKYLIGK